MQENVLTEATQSNLFLMMELTLYSNVEVVTVAIIQLKLIKLQQTQIVYDVIEEGSIEGWNIAEGDINIKGSNVEFGKHARWRMNGLSTDPSYFRDEVNLRLTENGHIVGKMAFFLLSTNQGEIPRNPLYPTLTEHKRSTPIDLNNIKKVNAKLFIDVEDWAGSVMYISSCKYQ